ncbi:MAG: flagellar hook-basal body complex protein FliE [Rhizomicrobium sp.]
MAVLPAAAAAAYRAAAQMATPASSASAASSTGSNALGAGNFSDFLSSAVKDSISTIKQGENMAAKQVAGKAELIDVVTAVNAAELSLNTVVAVRDKVISAYQTIMSMSI